MKKILFVIIIISIALIGIGFLCATNVNSGSSDLPTFCETQPIIQLESNPCPDLFSLSADLRWHHHERRQRG